jgi:hypothetical protein
MTTRSLSTFDPAGGGEPRLVFSAGGRLDRTGSQLPREVPLRREGTVIGSAADAGLRLPGVAAEHGRVYRDDADEYVYSHTAATGISTVNGRRVTRMALHTGDRLAVGPWVLVFARAEFADHGRPDYGRQGGELSAGPRVGA